MFGFRNTTSGIVGLGTGAPRNGKWKLAPSSHAFWAHLVRGYGRKVPKTPDVFTRSELDEALEMHVGQDNVPHALRLGGVGPDDGQPLATSVVQHALDAALEIKRFHMEINRLQRVHVECLIARNAEDLKIVEGVMERGEPLDDMVLSKAAQAKVDAAKADLEAKRREFERYLKGK